MRVVYSYFTAVAIAFASICVQGATTEKDQQGPMAPALKTVGDSPAPVTSEYFAILDRSFKAADAMAPKPTKKPVTRRPTGRPTTSRAPVVKPTRRPTQRKPTRKPTQSTSVPTISPTPREIQDPLTITIQPSDMPTAIPKHGGRFWTLEPSSTPTKEPTVADYEIANGNHVLLYSLAPTQAPSYLEKQMATGSQIINNPTQEPTLPPNEIPKHGGIYWTFPPK